jgi:XRE family transcriptional regulator, aerobic/anaerobic benzoate catabolism transcriptional regulator
MSSTIVHFLAPVLDDTEPPSINPPAAATPTKTAPLKVAPAARSALLAALGRQVRSARKRRLIRRKALAIKAGISERHLANLEQGTGNASYLVLVRLAQALECSLAELIAEEPPTVQSNPSRSA